MQTQKLIPAAAREIAAAIENEKRRTLAILAEARTLGVADEHLNAALADGISATEFVAKYHPVEALARQICQSRALA